MQMKISATINRLVDKPDSNIKAFASVSFDGFYAVHGIKVCEEKKGGLFPCRQLSTPTVTGTSSIRIFSIP